MPGAVGGAGGSRGGASRGGASRSAGGIGKSGGVKGGAKGASKSAAGTKANATAKADQAKADAKAKAADAKAKADALQKTQMETKQQTESRQQAERTTQVNNDQARADQQKADANRQQAVDAARQATDAAKATEGAKETTAKDIADKVIDGTKKGTDLAKEIAKGMDHQRAADLAGKTGGLISAANNANSAIQNGIETVRAAQEGRTNDAINAAKDTVVDSAKTISAVNGLIDPNLTKGALKTFGKGVSRLAGPAGAIAAASDWNDFNNAITQARRTGTTSDAFKAGWAGVKAGLSTMSLAPGAGAVPGAVATAMDVAEFGANAIAGWFN
jgi:hypothetical protein